MPIMKKVKPVSVAQKQVNTKFGQKMRYFLFVEGEEVPYGTWNHAFAIALKEQIGKVVQIAFEKQGQYKNLIVPERFKRSGKLNLIFEKVSQMDQKLDQILEKLKNNHGNLAKNS